MIRDAVVLADPIEVSGERVAGVPLVKRALIVLGRAGVTRAHVVGSDAVLALVDGDPEVAKSGITIDRTQPGGPVIVARADHVFDVTIAKLAAAQSPSSVTALVAADGREVGVRVVPTFSAPDVAADATALVPADAVWHPARTAEERKAANTTLFRSLRKRTDGPVSRYLNRPMSLSVTRLLVNTNVTPNQMTIVANIIGALGVWFVFQATWMHVAIGGALVHLQSVLDGCDGELARLKFKSSRIGEWLDNVLDDQVNIGYGVALGFASAALTGQDIWRWIGIAAGAMFFLHNAAFYWQLAFVHRSGNPFLFRWWFEKPGVDVTAMLSTPTLMNKLGAALRSLIRRDLFLFAFMLLCFVRLPQVAALWYGLVALSQFIVMGLHLANGGAPAASRAAAPTR